MNVSLWQIINTTDFLTKIVLAVLIGMSIITWAIAFYKKMTIAAKIKSLQQAKNLLQNTRTMDDFLARLSVMQNTYAGEIITQFLADFKKLLKLYESDQSNIVASDWDLLYSQIMQRVDDELAREEFLVPVLSTQAQAAPLIGLFGTVWGLIHSFMGIAQQRSADIAAVAPGIAEALITTMGGLVVAIPALVLYNYVQGQIKKLDYELVELSKNCIWIMRSVLVSERKFKDTQKSAHSVQEML